MRRQTSMFDEYANTRTPRSHHASRLNYNATTCRDVLHILVDTGLTGAMVEEIADRLGRRCEHISWALSELRALNKIIRTDARRLSRQGGWCSVYIARQVMENI